MTAPKTLDDVKAVADDEQRVRAMAAYLDRMTDFRRQAMQVRDQAIRRLIAKHGPSEAARRAGMSLASIKTIRKGTD